MNVAQAMVHAFEAEGVRVSAGISGQNVNRIADALLESPDVFLCYSRQERVAFDVCDGYGRVTGQPGVAFSDSGPAVVNGMGGLLNSYGDSTPVLFLAPARDRWQVPQRGSKELPIHDVFHAVTKWTTSIIDPSQLQQTLRRAFVALRSGRLGPVVLQFPNDLPRMEVPDFSYEPVGPRLRNGGDPQAVDEAVEALARARRPFVCAGAGVLFSEATPELVELADLLTLPVTTTLNGKSAFPEDHPLSLGLGGVTKATYATFQATDFAAEADVILSIGCSFNKHVLNTPIKDGVTLIQVDIDAYELHKVVPADITVLGDAKLVLRQMIDAARDLLPASRLRPRPETAAEISKVRQEWMSSWAPNLTSTKRPIDPHRVTWELSQLLDPGETIVTHDAGSTRGSTSQLYLATTPRGFLGYGTQSCMGWSIGAAMGAKLAAPEKMAVAFIGDEAFGETGMDLETSTSNQIPILVVLNNNRGDPRDAGYSATRLAKLQPLGDYGGVARDLGVMATRVEDPERIRPALAEAINAVRDGRTALVEVITGRPDSSMHRDGAR